MVVVSASLWRVGGYDDGLAFFSFGYGDHSLGSVMEFNSKSSQKFDQYRGMIMIRNNSALFIR